MGGMIPVHRPQNESSTNLFTQDVGKFSTTNPPSDNLNLEKKVIILDKLLIDRRICSRTCPRDTIPLSWTCSFSCSTRQSFWGSVRILLPRIVSSIACMIPRKMVTGSKSGLLELMAKFALLRSSWRELVMSSRLPVRRIAPGMWFRKSSRNEPSKSRIVTIMSLWNFSLYYNETTSLLLRPSIIWFYNRNYLLYSCDDPFQDLDWLYIRIIKIAVILLF